jgi:hypothetical protein
VMARLMGYRWSALPRCGTPSTRQPA